jgi:hypothetical protein
VRALPNLKELERNRVAVLFNILSLITQKLVSLVCNAGLFILPSEEVEFAALKFPLLEKAVFVSNGQDLQHVVTLLKNTNPASLKELSITHSESYDESRRSGISSADVFNSLAKVIKVCFDNLMRIIANYWTKRIENRFYEFGFSCERL